LRDGTGDLALEFKRAVGAEGEVIGTDFCAEMLESAPAKAARLALDVKFAVRRRAGAAVSRGELRRGLHAFGTGTWTTRCAACARWPGW